MTIEQEQIAEVGRKLLQNAYIREAAELKPYEELVRLVCELIDNSTIQLPKCTCPKRKVCVWIWEDYSRNSRDKGYLIHKAAIARTPSKSTGPTTFVTTKETTMPNLNTPVETISYIYGVDIKTMTTEQLIAALRKTQEVKVGLVQLNSLSKKVSSLIDACNNAMKLIEVQLDA